MPSTFPNRVHDATLGYFQILSMYLGLRLGLYDALGENELTSDALADRAGIEGRIEPPDAFDGDVYRAADLPQVPASLDEAIGGLAASSLARSSFGEAFVDHYLHFLRTEAGAYRRVVTDWERARYFERI